MNLADNRGSAEIDERHLCNDVSVIVEERPDEVEDAAAVLPIATVSSTSFPFAVTDASDVTASIFNGLVRGRRGARE